MSSKVRAVVDYFSIVGGVWQETPANLGIMEPSSRAARRKGNLYVLVESPEAGSDMDVVCQKLVDIILDQYYRFSGSVTGGLLAGVSAANAYLLEENQQSPQAQRVYPGVSCVVLKEQDLFIAQVGPALVYVVHDGQAQSYPGGSPWLKPGPPRDPESTYMSPLGLRREIEPELHHRRLQSGDFIVLACSALVRLATESQVADAVAYKGAETATQNLETLASGRDLSAIVIELGGERTIADRKVLAPPARPGRVSSSTSVSRDVIIEKEELPVRDAQPPPLDTEWEEGLEEEYDVEDEELEDLRAGVSLEKVSAGVKQGFLRVGSAFLTTLKRVLPEPGVGVDIPSSSTAKETPRVGTRTLVVLSLLIPVLVALLVVVTRYQYEKSRQSQHGDYLVEARLRMTEALGASDREMVRAGLRESLELVNQAIQLNSEDEKALELWWKIQDQLDTINLVTRLYTHWNLAGLPGPSEGAGQGARVLVQGSDVYLLDRNTDQVFAYRLNEVGDALVPTDDPLLIKKEDQIGDIVVDDLIEMLWMPAGGARQTSNMLVLERGGSLLEYTLGAGIRVFPVANAAEWRKVRAAGAYRGNFYVLDPLSNRILKYVPGVEGYTTPPEDYISAEVQIDLGGAVDMTIDGHVYVLLGDGTVYKFLSGELKPFSQAGLDVSLKNPSAIFAAGDMDGGHIYIADTGNHRVVQFSKDGSFLRQFRAAEGSVEMDQLQGLFVDEARGRLFLINGNSLLLTNIPGIGGAP